MKKTLLVASMLISCSSFANNGLGLCEGDALDSLSACERGDIIIISAALIPLYCEFDKQIIEIHSNAYKKFGLDEPVSCVYIGGSREIATKKEKK
jgi:hypothetical protein